MEKPKILIADSGEEFRSALADALHSVGCVQTACDGPQTLAMLQAFLPDMLVLDLMLPGLDGISLMHRAEEQGLRPRVLATTCCTSEYVISRLDQLAVDYIIQKPCELRATVARILDLCGHMKHSAPSHPGPSVLVANTLHLLGIPTKLHGCGYLREAITLMAQDRNQSLTKELYPAVGRIFGATAYQVERSIRGAIHAAWEQREDAVWQQYMRVSAGGQIPRPTNAEFICRLADLLLLNPTYPDGE